LSLLSDKKKGTTAFAFLPYFTVMSNMHHPTPHRHTVKSHMRKRYLKRFSVKRPFAMSKVGNLQYLPSRAALIVEYRWAGRKNKLILP